jgi:hypothetical protein
MPNSPNKDLNLGEAVTLKSGETLRVREMTFEQLLLQSENLAALFSAVMDAAPEGKVIESNQTVIIVRVLQSPALLKFVKDVVSGCTSKEVKYFDDLPVSDWIKLIKAVMEVHDLKELYELFTKLGPKKIP